MDPKLLKEIDAIAKVMHLSRTDWIRMKITKAVQEDSIQLSDTIILSYCKGQITKNELVSLLGKDAVNIAEKIYPDVLHKK